MRQEFAAHPDFYAGSAELAKYGNPQADQQSPEV